MYYRYVLCQFNVSFKNKKLYITFPLTRANLPTVLAHVFHSIMLNMSSIQQISPYFINKHGEDVRL